MEGEFRALLTGYAPLAALVSTRIYWNAYPQGAKDPAVRLTKVTGAPGYTTQGPDGLTGSIVQIDVRATTVTGMWAVRDAIIARLSGYQGTQDSVFFGGIFLTGERQTADESTGGLYHVSQLDFDVWSSGA